MPSHCLARSAAAALLAACFALAGVEGFLYTREVQVPAGGWVRVPLDLPAVQHLAPGGADLHVFAPGGTEVALRVAPAALRSERRAVTVVKVEKGEGGGWTLLLDVGAEPAPHERLFFVMAEMTVAPSVRLDGSLDGGADNKSWHPLATGDMFRLGEREGLQQISLSYPSTEDRYLRLAWPQAAGFPRVEAVEVETVSGPSLAFATRGAECQAGPGSAACALALPAPGQVVRRLTLDVEGPGAVGFRLYAARDGTWRLLHEGTWQRAGSRTQHFVDGAEEPLAGSILRLELFGAGKTAPRLTGWGVDLAAQTVVFQAEVPGRYVLAYGGAVRRNQLRNQRGDEPPAGAGTAWLAAGPEKEQAAAPAPPDVGGTGGTGAPLGRARFDSSWTVIAPSAKPGDLVRLEVPDVVYVNARPDLGDLRLAMGQEQIPFFRWTPPEPALAGGKRGLRPAPAHRAGESEAEVTLPAAGLPLTEVALTTLGGPLRRTVGVRYLEPIRRSRLPDDPRERQPVARTLWECDPEPPLPCRAALPLPGAAPKILSVRLDDGDNPPLAGLDVELWRRRDVLLFVWPPAAAGSAEPVRLLAGSERLTAPAYDFATLGEELLARSWQPADLDLAGTVPKDGGKPWTRWALPAALTLAGIGLLFLLRRILAEH
jgi:hypothetical protein